MRELQNSIRNELQRIAETYKSDFEIAKQNEESVQKQLDHAVSQSQVTNEAQVALRELESNAQTYRALYDNFLQRYMESVQQQSFPITEARVISAATRPGGKSNRRPRSCWGWRRWSAWLSAWRRQCGVSLPIGCFARPSRSRRVLQTDCIALVPAVKEGSRTANVTDARRGIKRERPRTRSSDRKKRAIARRWSTNDCASRPVCIRRSWRRLFQPLPKPFDRLRSPSIRARR